MARQRYQPAACGIFRVAMELRVHPQQLRSWSAPAGLPLACVGAASPAGKLGDPSSPWLLRAQRLTGIYGGSTGGAVMRPLGPRQARIAWRPVLTQHHSYTSCEQFATGTDTSQPLHDCLQSIWQEKHGTRMMELCQGQPGGEEPSPKKAPPHHRERAHRCFCAGGHHFARRTKLQFRSLNTNFMSDSAFVRARATELSQGKLSCRHNPYAHQSCRGSRGHSTRALLTRPAAILTAQTTHIPKGQGRKVRKVHRSTQCGARGGAQLAN